MRKPSSKSGWLLYLKRFYALVNNFSSRDGKLPDLFFAHLQGKCFFTGFQSCAFDSLRIIHSIFAHMIILSLDLLAFLRIGD